MAGLLGHVGSNIREGCRRNGDLWGVSEDEKFVDGDIRTEISRSGVVLTISEIMELTEDLAINDLRDLNKEIVKRIRMLHAIEDLKTAAKFSVGDDVSFISKRHGKVEGKVTKINRKTIGVKCTNIIGRGDWRVSPSILILDTKSKIRRKTLKVGRSY